MMRTVGAPLISVVVATAVLQAQQPMAPLMFEAASVKRNPSGFARVSIDSPPGRYVATGAPLRAIIVQAYQLQNYQVINAPGWVDSELFDIVARQPEGTFTREQRREMVQSLLRDRFKLVTRRETRQLPVYNLTLARSDGRLGPELRRSTIDCAAVRVARAAAPAPTPLSSMPRPGEVIECSTTIIPNPGAGLTLTASAMRFEQLPRVLTQFVARPVYDKTGLTGEFDVVLRALPEPGSGSGFRPPPAALPDTDIPTVFTAIQEQLGLRLESARGPAEVLVIESVSRPTDD